MQGPSVNAVGIVERPDDYAMQPRPYPATVRVAAAVILATFAFVTLSTSVISLATYCLTSQAGMPFPFFD
jgi:hypothetical protein